MTIKKKKKTRLFSPLSAVVFIFLSLWCLSMCAALFWLVNNSLKGQLEYEWSQVTLATEPLKYLRNYLDAFTEMTVKGNNMLNMLFNTIWVTVGAIGLDLISSVTFSYVIARYKFPGRDAIYWTIIMRMVIVINGSLASTMKLYDALHFINSPLILLTHLSGLSGFLMYYTTFKGISRDYAESAFIDGASHFKVFYKVMLPHATGVIIANVIPAFIGHWNEYMTYILYLDRYPGIAAGIYYFRLASEDHNYPMLLAACVMSIIPAVTVFACFQKYFINIDISGGLKG